MSCPSRTKGERTAARKASRVAVWLGLLLAVGTAGCAGAAGEARATAGAAPPGLLSLELRPRPPLRAGPGHGFRTGGEAMLRPLRAGVRVQPILTVGDTLASADPGADPFVFASLPDGIGVTAGDDGTALAFVAHEIPWRPNDGARLSRLLLDRSNGGVLAADYVLDGTEGYSRLCAATLADSRDGFLRPKFLVNEESTLGPRRGVVAAVDVRDGTVRDLPWLGLFPHENTIVVPVSSGRIAAVLTEDAEPGESGLYLYLADTDADFLAGRGQLHVFRADPGFGGSVPRNPAAIRRGSPISGRFVPLRPSQTGDPLAWADAARRAGAFPFVRLEDAAPDRERTNAFYFVDTGESGLRDYGTARAWTGNGRVYHVELDPFDATRVTQLSVLLDGDEGDDLFRPDNIETDGRCLMIQEDPGSGRGLHPARILRYDLPSRRLEAIAECTERDSRGRLLPSGQGGEWESTGICDASAVFGEDAWLTAVQAHSLEQRVLGRRAEAGQLLLLLGPRWKPPEGDGRGDQ